MNKKIGGLMVVIGLAVILAGCGQTTTSESAAPAAEDTAPAAETAGETVTTAETATATAVEPKGDQVTEKTQPLTNIEIPRPENQLAAEEYRWSQLLQRDSIYPVYDPEFATAENAPYDDEELVIGVEINGEAKAYAIGPLNGREMVNDTVGGTPVLVTW